MMTPPNTQARYRPVRPQPTAPQAPVGVMAGNTPPASPARPPVAPVGVMASNGPPPPVEMPGGPVGGGERFREVKMMAPTPPVAMPSMPVSGPAPNAAKAPMPPAQSPTPAPKPVAPVSPPPPAPVVSDRDKYYDPDPSSPTYNPDRALPWRPAPAAGDPEPPGGYNNPANAPKNELPEGSDPPLPPAPPKGQPLPKGPAQVPPKSPLPSGPPPMVDLPDPGGSLRKDIYAPGDDPRLKGAQSATDRAGGIVQDTHRQPLQNSMEDRYRALYGTGGIDASGFGVNPDVDFNRMNTQVGKGPAVDPMESARTAKYGAAQDAALEGLGGPSRTELAKKALADFEAQGQVGLEQRFRKVGQTAAKFGRMGMGDVNAELGSIQGDYERDRLQKQNDLARSVAEGDISDRFRRVDATSGLRGQESAIDTGMRGERRTEREYGTGIDERNLERGRDERTLESALSERNVGRRMSERDTRLGITEGNQDRAFDRTRAAIDTATGQTDRNIGDVYDRYDAAGSLEDRLYGQGRGNRDEMRSERGRQDTQAQQTIENRLQQFRLQQELEDQRIRRAAALAQAGGL
jgi:hypothetical protein